jgi:hypothetical protein
MTVRVFKFPDDSHKYVTDQALLAAALDCANRIAAEHGYPHDVSKGFVMGRMLALGIESYLRAGVPKEKLQDTVRDLIAHL